MKINGTNHSKINPYQNQQYVQKKSTNKARIQADQLQISEQAKQLQSKDTRSSYVNEIQKQVENGEYKVDNKETARKLFNFWKV